MTLAVRGSDLEHDELRELATRRLGFALGRFGSLVTSVRVSLVDENGPRGGVDKTCRVEVRGPRRLAVVVTDHGEDERTAIGRAAERAGRAFARALERRRDRRD
jgi:hypothetical protein